MKLFSFCTLLLVLYFQTPTLHSQSCECPGDSDGNGVVTASDLLAILNSTSCSMPDYDGCSDINQDGLLDLRDVMTFEGYWGSSCPSSPLMEALESSFTGLHVVEHQDYQGGLIGSDLGPETGSKVFRIYAHFDNPEEDIACLYGYEDSPFILHHTAPFYFLNGFEISNPANSSTGFLINAIPELAVRSYFTAGIPEEAFPNNDELQLFSTCSNQMDIDEALSTQSESYDSGVDGFFVGRLLFEPYEEIIEESEPYKLIAQFTTTGDFELQINLATRFYGSARNIQNTYHEGIVASSGNLDVFGCTDPVASNYDPNATLNQGCSYLLGDLNGDGDISGGDVLILLSEYGCSSNCGSADINEDAVVNAADLILLLGDL